MTEDSLAASPVRLPEGCFLRQKTLYEYTTPDNVYDVELFENPDGTAYAIGIPREGRRMVIFGTPVLPSRERALQAFIQKVKHEGYMAKPGGEPQDDAEDNEDLPLEQTEDQG